MARTNLTAQRVRELLDYDPDTGLFTWANPQPSSKFKSGQQAGGTFVDHSGRRRHRIKLDGHHWYSGRIAWLYMTGAHATFFIDHINGNPMDNRFANLRDVPNQINTQNIHTPPKTSKHGFLGVMRNGTGWTARISIDGERTILGTFKTPELAHAAYIAAKRKLHPGCTI